MNPVFAYTSSATSISPSVTISCFGGDSGLSSITSISPHDLLDFLLQWGGLRTTWDLDQFVAPILRLLPLSICRSLAGPDFRAFFRPYSIVYNRGKVFFIRRGRLSATFYHISQYWPDGEPDPPDVVSLYVKALSLLNTISHSTGFTPHRLTSPVAIYEDILFRHLHLPVAADVPDSAWGCIDYAQRCTDRQWISAYQVGHWDECWHYDISAAYSSEAARLLDFHGAEFVHSSSYIPSANYGFLHGRVTITHPISPIMAEMGEYSEHRVNPVGSWETYLTLDEVRFIQRWNIGDFEMYDGWFVICKPSSYPLQGVMQSLYSRRGGDALLDGILKRAANGLIGKFLEIRREGAEVGRYYNPIWHAAITSRTRLRVADFLYAHEASDSLIHIGTDGCLLDRAVLLSPSNGMGSWRMSYCGPAFVLSPGLVFFGDKHPKGIHYDSLKSMVVTHPRSSEYRFILPRRTTLSEAVASGDIVQVGEMRDFYSMVDLLALPHSQDRIFLKLPATGQALMKNHYRSGPISL